jgi:pimeloyl-ACP methyl ester carboxylesterase
MEIKGKFISLDGLKLRYVRGGRGPEVLLIHGLGASLDYWDENVEPLSEHFTVTAFDLPWFGKSSIPETKPELEFFVSTIRKFCIELGLEKISPIGNSLGGALAAALAGKHPELVDKLVLVSPGGFGREVSTTLRLLSIPVVGRALLRPSRTVAREAITSLFYDPARVKEAWVDIAHAYFRSSAARKAFLKVVHESINIFGQRSDRVSQVTALARQIRARTLVVWGTEDRVIPSIHVQRVTESIPDCISYIFERCGHVPMMELPEDFNRISLEFLHTGSISRCN